MDREGVVDLDKVFPELPVPSLEIETADFTPQFSGGFGGPFLLSNKAWIPFVTFV